MFFDKLIDEIFSWMKTIIFVVTLSVLISIFVFEPYYVSGSSMEPTLDGADIDYEDEKGGDRVIIFKSLYYFGSQPKYGDIVILDSRVERERHLWDELMESALIRLIRGETHTHIWIKRVIGEPGDILESRDDQIYRNGTPLQEDYIQGYTDLSFDRMVVPDNHVFVMGDNRHYSKDSRQIGSIPLDHVKGRLIVRYFPFHKISSYL
jgi:signal peptidase I